VAARCADGGCLEIQLIEYGLRGPGIVHGEQDEVSVRSADPHLDASLFIVVRLIGYQFEAQFPGVKRPGLCPDPA